MSDPFAEDLADKGLDVGDDDDEPPAFLKKGAKADPFAADLAAKGFTAEPAETRPIKNTGPIEDVRESLKAPAYEPTMTDKIVGGIGSTATNALDAATLGLYSKGRNAAYRAADPELADATEKQDAKFNTDHAFVAGLGKGVGYAAPMGVPGLLSKGIAAGGEAALEAGPAALREFIATHPLTTGLVTKGLTGAAAAGATTAGEDAVAGAPFEASLADAGDAAMSGGALGAGLGTAAEMVSSRAGQKLTAAARARAIKQNIGDIVGNKENGRAIATDIKKMAKAIEPIRAEMATPEGMEIADVSRTDPEAGLDLVKAKIRDITKERLPDYRTVDAASKTKGGVRAGDFVQHLEDSATALEDTGRGKDSAIAAEVRKAANRLRRAKDWGGGASAPIDMKAPFDKNYTNGQYLDLMTKAGQRDVALADLEAKRGPAGWNPDTIVPTDKLRGIVTDMQSTAYDNLGGINGTEAFKKSQKIAGVGESFLNKHLDEVAKADPKAAEAVDRIREMNKKYNAYATIRNALKTRVGKVDTANIGMSPSTETELGRRICHRRRRASWRSRCGFCRKEATPWRHRRR
jgi:hypothetical protein